MLILTLTYTLASGVVVKNILDHMFIPTWQCICQLCNTISLKKTSIVLAILEWNQNSTLNNNKKSTT